MAIGETTYETGTPTGGAVAAPSSAAPQPHGDAERRAGDTPERLARALGWFSIGLGLAEIAAPRRLAHLIGIADTDARRLLFRALGLREIASGAGILSGRGGAGWLWSRVGGDAMDLGLLGRALTLRDADPRRVTTATVAVAGVTALDVYASERMTRRAGRGVDVHRSVTIERSPEEVYRFWRDLQNLPRFMRHLESVEPRGDGRSHWTAKAPAGTTVEWDAEIVDDEPGRRIAWRSLEGATVPNHGTVAFETAPGNRGTVVRVSLRYEPPGGSLGAAVAKLFGEEPGQQVADDLRRLKQILETGEIATARGPAARQRPSIYGQ